MAQPAGTLRAGRYFLALLGLFVVLYLIVFWPGARHTPKLGLDLEGGAQVIFQARTPNGATPPKSSMEEARAILEQRVNGSGVSNAEVIIQGNDQIVVSIPGQNTSDIKDLGAAAKLNFRPVAMPPVPVTPPPTPSGSATPSAAATPSGSATPGSTASAPPSPAAESASASGKAPAVADARPLATGAASPSAAPGAAAPSAPAASASPSASPAAAAKKTSDPLKGLPFGIPKSESEFDKLSAQQQQQLAAAMANFDCASKPPDADKQPLLACDSTTAPTLIYLLGPVIVPGTEISSSTAVPPNAQSGTFDWTVSLSLKSSGQTAWAEYTGAHNTGGRDSSTPITQCAPSTTPCADFVAFTLDGAVVSSPFNKSAINGQATQISGGFTEDSAKLLARQLKYGALPLNFSPLTSQNISPSLGSAQLKAGMLAGGIGLALVVIYSLIYYRALGFVTIASLIVSGGLTYACLVVLGKQIGFTLTLAGIAGFIVAVGITADSFVVFFERIKDEVHEGRSMRVAVPRAWTRARRTILSADTVSFLAAAVLYYFAAGDVKGFAFTLGLSTILDLVVVFLFTHPMVSLLSRSAAFGSARFSGLSAAREGAVSPAAAVLEPAPAAHRGRRIRPGRAARGSSAVAVLDRDTAEVTDAADAGVSEGTAPRGSDSSAEPVARPAPSRATAAQPAGEVPEQPPASGMGEQPPSTPPKPVGSDAEAPAAASPTGPRPGTAAERAAARRARMRAEAAEKGQR